MPTLNANGLRIAFATDGDPKGAPLLLIAGLGQQLTAWPDELVDALAELGFYVIRFDHRDCGLSTKFAQAGLPNLAAARLKSRIGWPLRPPYTLADMAEDAIGVLSALGVARAHVAGVAMGGMIAHRLAAHHASRVLSLTSIMASSGRRGLPGPGRQVRAALLRRPARPQDPECMLEHTVGLLKAVGSPAYPTSDKLLRRRAARCLRRSCCLPGVARQMLAVTAAGDQSALLRAIAVPTLVIHGAADPVVPLACGIDSAAAIPGARLEIIEGMGHDLPLQLVERLASLIDAHAHGKMLPDSTPRFFVKQ